MSRKPITAERQQEYQTRFNEKHPGKKAEWNKAWIQNNRDRYNASKFIYREKCKREAMLRYSNGEIKCAKCGFKNIDALCLDHINDNGAEHRKELGISSRNGGAGINTYEGLKRAGWPDGLQVLCFNCNQIKEMERKRRIRLQNKWYSERVNGQDDQNPL